MPGAPDMFVRTILFLLLAMSSTLLIADEPSMGPIIGDYGPTYPIEYRDVPLAEGFTFRVVFDAGAYPGEVDSLNSELVSVARYLNMHGRNGVPLENMDIAVVLHGNALSMHFRGFEKKELVSPVKVGLSAMTMLTVLQSDGYALLP